MRQIFVTLVCVGVTIHYIYKSHCWWVDRRSEKVAKNVAKAVAKKETSERKRKSRKTHKNSSDSDQEEPKARISGDPVWVLGSPLTSPWRKMGDMN